jgi:uncharacterized protein (TIGR04255 family)
VNDTDVAYDWDSRFFPLIKDALTWLEEAYEGMPVFLSAELRYIDSVRVAEHGFKDWDSFVGDNLNIKISQDLMPEARVLDVGLHQVIELPDGGQLLVAVNSGKRDKDDALIWQTAINQPGPFDKRTLVEWADQAHARSKQVFKDICKPHFHERFTRDPGTDTTAS